MIAQHVAHLDFLEEQIATFDTQVTALMQPPADVPADPPAELPPTEGSAGNDAVAPQGGDDWASARTICDAVPGIGPRVAEIIIAELGTDISRFPTVGHAASWARLSPGQNESAGKRRSSRIGKGNRYLRAALIQAAWAAIKVRSGNGCPATAS